MKNILFLLVIVLGSSQILIGCHHGTNGHLNNALRWADQQAKNIKNDVNASVEFDDDSSKKYKQIILRLQCAVYNLTGEFIAENYIETSDRNFSSPCTISQIFQNSPELLIRKSASSSLFQKTSTQIFEIKILEELACAQYRDIVRTYIAQREQTILPIFAEKNK